MTLRAGIIGLGVGEAHIAGYQAHPECRVTALCDFSESKFHEAQAKYPEMKVTKDSADILRDPEIDIVSIASYDSYHHAQMIEALKSGKHVFVEKPLCLYPEQAEEIHQLLLKNPRLRLSSNLILRTSPRFLKLKSLIEQNKLGEVFAIDGDYLYGRLHKITEGWRADEAFHSVVYGGAVHLIDLMQWLVNDSIVEVSAYGNRIASRGSKFGFNDCVYSVLKFKSGIVGKVSANYGCVMPHFHGLHVYGNKGTFINGFESAAFYQSRDPRACPEAVTEAYPGVHKGGLLHGFVESILTGKPAKVSAEDVFRAMAVCFAIEESAASGQPAAVKYFEESLAC